MEREILFRGYSKYGKGWLYGDLVRNVEGDFAVRPPYKMGMEHRCDIYEVAPNTIGQYTGIKDKNGNRIFEGDILDFTVFDWQGHGTQYRGVVKYEGAHFMLWLSCESEYYGADSGFFLDWVVDQDSEATVIGNVFENKELLKE